MAEKILNTRIVCKHDTEDNWKSNTTFIPKKGELIIYDSDNQHLYQRIKIGDGTSDVTTLKFVNEQELSEVTNLLNNLKESALLQQDNYLPVWSDKENKYVKSRVSQGVNYLDIKISENDRPNKRILSESYLITNDYGEGTHYCFGKIVNKDKTLTLPVVEGTIATVKDIETVDNRLTNNLNRLTNNLNTLSTEVSNSKITYTRKVYSSGEHIPIYPSSYFMVKANGGTITLCNSDGTSLITDMKLVIGMCAGVGDDASPTGFVIMGVYTKSGGLLGTTVSDGIEHALENGAYFICTTAASLMVQGKGISVM